MKYERKAVCFAWSDLKDNFDCSFANLDDIDAFSPAKFRSLSRFRHQPINMKADLIKVASEVISNPQILVNMVSRRVRQLSFGHRPLVQVAPGTLAADIALTEIIEKKLTFESTFDQEQAGASVVAFPETLAAARKAA
jgi:DNA-directed RNA polymerase subunit omega